MDTILAASLTPAAQYKLLSGTLIPRPIAWLTTESADHTVLNLAPFSFFTGVAKELPLVSVAILRRDGQPKDTAANLLATGETVIHLVNPPLAEAMNASAATLPPAESENQALALPLVASTIVKVPGLADAPARLEATVYQHVPIIHPSGAVMSDLFVLQLQAFHFAPGVYNAETVRIDPAALDPIARLAGPNYATLGPTFSLIRPK